jgi:hypothetical protein
VIERLYGWGSGAVPMPKPAQSDGAPPGLPRTALGADLIRHAIHDVPWRTLTGCLSLTIGGLLALSALHTQLPVLTQEAAPVTIAVRFLEPPPEPTPIPIAEQPKAPAVLQPEKTRPKILPALPERPLPVAAVSEPAPPTPLPRKEEVVAHQREETLPAVTSGMERIDLGPLPDLSPPSQRSKRDEIPDSGPVVFASSAGRDLALSNSGISSEHYRERRSEDPMNELVRRERAGLQRSADPEALPATKLASFQERPAQEMPLPESKSVLRRTAATEITPSSLPSREQRIQGSGSEPPATRSASFEFFERESPPDLDHTRLVSLTELRTCLDPLAESELRTRLATALSRPGTCRSGGVFFDFHQPESAWSIRIDIYNYEGATFRDRCAALQRAVECSEYGRRNLQ